MRGIAAWWVRRWSGGCNRTAIKICCLRGRDELDLTEQQAVISFFAKERPEYVFLAAAKVGGILANSTYPADFVAQNLMIQTNVIR